MTTQDRPMEVIMKSFHFYPHFDENRPGVMALYLKFKIKNAHDEQIWTKENPDCPEIITGKENFIFYFYFFLN